MTDVQVRGKKIALLDSSDNIIYTLPDSAGTAGNAIVTDGAGKLFFGGINLNSVLTAGDSSNLNATILGNVRLGTTVVDSLDFVRPGGLASHGYSIGGASGPSVTTNLSTADKFPFASDTIVSESIIALSAARRLMGSNASSTHAYSMGATHETDPNAVSSRIEKFSFAQQSNRINDVGDLSQIRIIMNDGTQSSTHGYTAGGNIDPPTITSASNVIDKFPFSTDTNATDVGDLTQARDFVQKPGSATHGYAAGGRGTPFPSNNTATNIIEKYPFASDANAADVGDLALTRTHRASSQNSDTNGYVSGGRSGPPGATLDDIQKFPFVSDGNATNVGNLNYARYSNAGSSSQSRGYMHGGGRFNPPSPFAAHDDISAFPFATDTAVGYLAALTTTRWSQGGTQG